MVIGKPCTIGRYAACFCVSILAACVLNSATAQADAPNKSGQENKGGRHWVKKKTAPPSSPVASLKSFQIEPGLKIELVAAEPLVMDPTEITFDRFGRMFVVEFADYPNNAPPKSEAPLSRVVLLEDTNRDGRMDKRHVFADKLFFAHSLMAYKEGILVCTPTQVLYLQDTDGDNKADIRKTLFSGFQLAHPQQHISNPRWGLDNWIYMNHGRGKITSADKPGKPVQIPVTNFRFHPISMEFGPAGGHAQYGNTIDNWGRRFFCNNRNPIVATALSYAASRRNPYTIVAKLQYDVAPSGGASRVFPLIEMKSNWLLHAGTHTAACGTTAYRGDLLGEAYTNSVFVCEPIGHLVTRSIVKPNGVLLKSERARPKADFLASTDPWFRPINLANGPDGALYVVDMYRLWVEHPKFLPKEVSSQLDWRAGDDRGRIWRVVPAEGRKPRPYVPPKTAADLVKMLSDGNGWRRQLAQRVLVERQSKDGAAGLADLLAQGGSEFTRLHALWTLDGIGALRVEYVEQALQDASPFVRKDAVKLASRFFDDRPSLLQKIVDLEDDEDIRVRFQVALTLGQSSDPKAGESLARIGHRDGGDPWFTTAILTSAKEHSGTILLNLLNADRVRRLNRSTHMRLVSELATITGVCGRKAEIVGLLSLAIKKKETQQWWQPVVLTGLSTGIARRKESMERRSLTQLLANTSTAVADLVKRKQKAAIDSRQSVSDRVAAVALLGHFPSEKTFTIFENLLVPKQPIEIQLACVEALGRSGSEDVASIVLKHWSSLGPKVRRHALAMLLRRTNTTRQVLEAMIAGKINPATVDLDSRVRLLEHPDESAKSLATKLFGAASSKDRSKLVAKYMPAVTMNRSAELGRKVFTQACAKCHRLDGQGGNVGPDLSDSRNRTPEAMLIDILDPNRKVEPKFAAYTVATDDGRVYNGLIVAETSGAIIIQPAEGKQQTISRNQIDELHASGKSMMPEGFEKEINIEQMAGLLKYLTTRAKPSPGTSRAGK